MRGLGYLYALGAVALIGGGIVWAAGSEPRTPAGGVVAEGDWRFTAVVPSEYEALSDCVVCHRLTPEGQDRSAPSLVGIVGAPVARSDWFAYSPALAKKDGTWTEEELARYLENPGAYLPGTFKTLSPIRDEAQRRDIVDALKRLSGARS